MVQVCVLCVCAGGVCVGGGGRFGGAERPDCFLHLAILHEPTDPEHNNPRWYVLWKECLAVNTGDPSQHIGFESERDKVCYAKQDPDDSVLLDECAQPIVFTRAVAQNWPEQ